MTNATQLVMLPHTVPVGAPVMRSATRTAAGEQICVPRPRTEPEYAVLGGTDGYTIEFVEPANVIVQRREP